MTTPNEIRQPLPARCQQGAMLLLACRRFSADALLIAADAFEEAAREARFERAFLASEQARALAERLRAEAPRRVWSHHRHSLAANRPGGAASQQDATP